MICAAGIKLIQEFEGCKLKAYLDEMADPPVWTIGWGDTGPDVREGTIWTQEQADARLMIRLNQEFGPKVLDLCVETPNEHQLAAMTSFAYNVGLGWEGTKKPVGARDGFRQSTLLRKHNAGDFVGAANEFKRWNKAGGVVRAGLTRRRAAEAALYLTPIDDRVQTTRATAEPPPPQSGIGVPAAIATATASLTGVQQIIAQVSDVWDGLARFGVSPHIVMAVLGAAAVGMCGYFLYNAWCKKED